MMDGSRCPMCGRAWQDGNTYSLEIPENLQTPESEEWLNRIYKVYDLEKLSKAQYENDSREFNLHMPYMRVIPDENNHISWIESLFSAYSVSYKPDVPKIRVSNSAKEAYQIARELEQDLIPRYEWLIQNAPDGKTKQVIETILFQTDMHYMMFTHALRMGGMMGPGMGHGMMGN
ncbi:MAG: hypothetical protein R6U50_02010 [Desulfobacterales bacterium]